ncbi:MAG: anthranilate synthase/aminodeoxychorismate synthase-like glutamine amidotransferase [Bradymonadia bacterium]
MRVLLIDNYDSFTFNLVQALEVAGAAVDVVRNDALTVEQAFDRGATHLMISPGPGRPEDAGITMPLLAAAIGRLPVLGVCLGHQALVCVLGGTVGAAKRLMHGKASRIEHAGTGLFEGQPHPMTVGRYHSLAAHALPDALEATAWTEDGEIMALRHRTAPAWGVQFHPESILTPEGDALLGRFLTMGARGTN